MIKKFDLNIEDVLENWEVYHAIREIIANAIDEQIYTNTQDIKIYKSEDQNWHIVDFGRGLNYHHLVQNENTEKKNDARMIGRFGVGLKDALATLYRHNIKVKINSRHCTITIKKSPKIGFEDISTLHAIINPPEKPNMLGTDFELIGCNDNYIDLAKAFFFKFLSPQILETTCYGQVINNNGADAFVYVNGVKVAEESNFLFSYNITNPSRRLVKAMNRERSNVGRPAYSDTINHILTACNSEEVKQMLVRAFRLYSSGLKYDELNWNDVQIFAAKCVEEQNKNTVFITPEILQNSPEVADEIKREGKKPIIVSSHTSYLIERYNKENRGQETLTTVLEYKKDKDAKFIPTIIDIEKLTPEEKSVYDKTDDILALIGGKPKNVHKICIVDKIYDQETGMETLGLWESHRSRILIKRKQLHSIRRYAGTLLHECTHASSGACDVNRDFELALTATIGKLVDICLRNDSNSSLSEFLSSNSFVRMYMNNFEKYFDERDYFRARKEIDYIGQHIKRILEEFYLFQLMRNIDECDIIDHTDDFTEKIALFFHDYFDALPEIFSTVLDDDSGYKRTELRLLEFYNEYSIPALQLRKLIDDFVRAGAKNKSLKCWNNIIEIFSYVDNYITQVINTLTKEKLKNTYDAEIKKKILDILDPVAHVVEDRLKQLRSNGNFELSFEDTEKIKYNIRQNHKISKNI